MFLKSIILFLYFQVCQSKVKILSYTLDDPIQLEDKINDFEYYNNIDFYDFIQVSIKPSTFLIIFKNDDYSSFSISDSPSHSPTEVPSNLPTYQPTRVPTYLPTELFTHILITRRKIYDPSYTNYTNDSLPIMTSHNVSY